MLTTVRTYVEKHQLLPDREKPVLVGLSGGADSVALLALLVRLGYPCVALHCNFALRGDESERDERFAESFAHSLSVPFHKTHFDTCSYASTKGISIEMAARELRYAWFEETRQQLDGQAIAVAHHRDDSVETLLLNLIRGTGVRGMRGIRPRNGWVVRPLLAVSREEIVDWLDKQALPFVTDSTNLTDVYTRNFIRLRVLPLLETINPSVRNTMARTAEHLAAVEAIYINVIEEARSKVVKAGNRLSIDTLLTYPSPETILYELLKPYHFTRMLSDKVYQSLQRTSGKQFYSPTHRLVKDRNHLLLSPLEEKTEVTSYFIEEGCTELTSPIPLSLRECRVDSTFQPKRDRGTATFDYDKLTFPLTLRRWQPGDWFIPFGMTGRKKVSDYFADRKFSLLQKEQTWLLCSGDTIVWIVGERLDNRFRTHNSTTHALIVNFFK